MTPTLPTAIMPKALATILGAAIAIIVLPLFAAQPLGALIASSFAMPQAATGLIAMMPMLGYAAGLVLLVPLIDIYPVRNVILVTLFAGVAGLVGAATAPSGPLFVLAAFVVGATTSATQMVVPFAASLVSAAERGRVIGRVMSGLMIGVLLSRPTASLAAEQFGWRGAYALDAAALGLVLLAFFFALPRRSALSYVELVGSLWTLLLSEGVLRRRVAYQALCMGAFGAFWTAVPLQLAGAPFNLTQSGIALFAFAGIGGAIIAPLAGWAADRGWNARATRLAHIAVVAGAILAGIGGAGWFGSQPAARPVVSLTVLVVAAVVLDLGVIADQTLGRHAVNLLRSDIRGRLNGLYTGLFFIGGAVGSALAGIAWARHGWTSVCAIAMCCGASAFAYAAVTETAKSSARQLAGP